MPTIITRGSVSAMGYGFGAKKGGPTVIGQAYGGGYYAGQISTAGNGVADYYLIVAPAATGQNLTGLTWGPISTTGATSLINGNTNSNILNSATYPAAYWCKQLTIGGYTDWYLPAKNELEVLYYYFKPDLPLTNNNNTSSGANPNAVSPEPINTNYTALGPPNQTTATAFRTGNSEVFTTRVLYWSSSEFDSNDSWSQDFSNGIQVNDFKYSASYVRAVRRIPV